MLIACAPKGNLGRTTNRDGRMSTCKKNLLRMVA